jgi:uncharacterized protein (TIGR02466 family)
MSIIKTSLFPTNIWILDNLLKLEDLKKIQKEINKLLKNKTQTNGDLQNNNKFVSLNEEIIKCLSSIFKNCFYKYEDFQITGMWGNNFLGNFHKPHNHANNFYSGVFYTEADETSAPITFIDPKQQSFVIRPAVEKYTIDNSPQWDIPCKTNRIIFFPSWLQHFVGANKIKSKRVSIAFNVMFKGRLNTINEFETNEF